MNYSNSKLLLIIAMTLTGAAHAELAKTAAMSVINEPVATETVETGACNNAPEKLDLCVYQAGITCTCTFVQGGKLVTTQVTSTSGTTVEPMRKYFVGPGAKAACDDYRNDADLTTKRAAIGKNACKKECPANSTITANVDSSRTFTSAEYKAGE